MRLLRLEPGRHRDRFSCRRLSGGERQRVAIASRALAAKPRIILMDEPFGALDPLTRDALSEDFRALHRDFGLTTVMITHDMTEALLLADRIAVTAIERIDLRRGTLKSFSATRYLYGYAELMGIAGDRWLSGYAALSSGPQRHDGRPSLIRASAKLGALLSRLSRRAYPCQRRYRWRSASLISLPLALLARHRPGFTRTSLRL